MHAFQTKNGQRFLKYRSHQRLVFLTPPSLALCLLLAQEFIQYYREGKAPAEMFEAEGFIPDLIKDTTSSVAGLNRLSRAPPSSRYEEPLCMRRLAVETVSECLWKHFLFEKSLRWVVR